MLSWRLWLPGLTVTMAWCCALITYMIEWNMGWIFAGIMFAVMFLAWVTEQDVRHLHKLQLMRLEKELSDERAANAASKAELDRTYASIVSITDIFLDSEKHCCQGCGHSSIWHFTRFKFHPNFHAHGCQVAGLRSLVEPPELWTPSEFNPRYLEPQWRDSPELRNDPKFADFFLDAER